MQKSQAYGQRLLRGQTPTYERLQQRLAEDGQAEHQAPVTLHCGWGRILIGHTYSDPEKLAINVREALIGNSYGLVL